jgi:hypothetical protein
MRQRRCRSAQPLLLLLQLLLLHKWMRTQGCCAEQTFQTSVCSSMPACCLFACNCSCKLKYTLRAPHSTPPQYLHSKSTRLQSRVAVWSVIRSGAFRMKSVKNAFVCVVCLPVVTQSSSACAKSCCCVSSDTSQAAAVSAGVTVAVSAVAVAG